LWQSFRGRTNRLVAKFEDDIEGQTQLREGGKDGRGSIGKGAGSVALFICRDAKVHGEEIRIEQVGPERRKVVYWVLIRRNKKEGKEKENSAKNLDEVEKR